MNDYLDLDLRSRSSLIAVTSPDAAPTKSRDEVFASARIASERNRPNISSSSSSPRDGASSGAFSNTSIPNSPATSTRPSSSAKMSCTLPSRRSISATAGDDGVRASCTSTRPS